MIKGCEVSVANNGMYNVSPGYVALSGIDQDGNNTFKVVPFSGKNEVTLPLYLTLAYNVIDREYADNKVKPIAYNFYAQASVIQPSEGKFLEIGTSEVRQFVDAIHLTEKLDKTGNGRDVTVTFSQETERNNIESGEKLSILWGKVCKWFVDLKKIAFTGAASDIIEDATHRFVTDTEKTTWNAKANNTLSNVTLVKSLGSNGYYKAPDGLIIQWGVFSIKAVPHTLSTSFSNTNYKIAVAFQYYNNNVTSVKPYSASKITVEGGPTADVNIMYIAVGY